MTVSLPIQKFREIVFQLLYSQDMGHTEEDHMIDLLMKELSVTRKSIKQAQARTEAIRAKLPEIDGMIAKTSRSYDFDRIQSVERNILRLGIYELFFDDSIPPKVAISEGVRLAKKFGTPESATFVNAIMDALYKCSLGENIDAEQLANSSEAMQNSEEIVKKVIEDIQQAE